MRASRIVKFDSPEHKAWLEQMWENSKKIRERNQRDHDLRKLWVELLYHGNDYY